MLSKLLAFEMKLNNLDQKKGVVTFPSLGNCFIFVDTKMIVCIKCSHSANLSYMIMKFMESDVLKEYPN